MGGPWGRLFGEGGRVTFAAMTRVFLNKKIGRRVENGHPWIYGNEVGAVDGEATGGAIVEVYTHDKKFIGKGYINPQSQIMIRLLTRDRNLQKSKKGMGIPAETGLYRKLPACLWRSGRVTRADHR
jgi:PUA-like domain